MKICISWYKNGDTFVIIKRNSFFSFYKNRLSSSNNFQIFICQLFSRGFIQTNKNLISQETPLWTLVNSDKWMKFCQLNKFPSVLKAIRHLSPQLHSFRSNQMIRPRSFANWKYLPYMFHVRPNLVKYSIIWERLFEKWANSSYYRCPLVKLGW